jgi:hypothetical protein
VKHAPIPELPTLAQRFLEARVECLRATDAARIAREATWATPGDELARRRWHLALERREVAMEKMERLDCLLADSNALAEALGRET